MALAACHAAGRAPWAAATPALAPRKAKQQQRRSSTAHVLRATKAPRGGKQQRAGVQEGAQDTGSSSVIMGTIQALLARAKEQQAVANRLRPSNAALAVELKTKAEQHLHTLMQLAERQQQQAPDAAAAEPDLLQQLTALSQQLELEQEAARTAASAAETSTSSGGGAANRARGRSTSSSAGSTSSPTSTSSSSSSSENDVLQTRLAEAEAAAASLQRQLADANATLQATADELHEHRDLQMAYDRQCQDMYKLRMQLQQAQQQGSAAAASAAQVVRQHKQDLSWLMQAHQKELNDAHRKHQELIQETQALRLKVLEQEQLLWGRGAATPADDAAAPAAAASEAVVAAAAPAAAASRSSQAAPAAADDAAAAAAAAAALQLQQDQHQLQQLQGELEQLSAEKQQLVKSLQDSQREQAVLLVELQHMRDAAAADSAAAAAADASASSSIEAAVAAARAEGAAAAEQQLMQRLTASEQQRDKLVRQLQELEASLAEAKAAAAAAAAAPAAVQPAASCAALSSRLDTAAAVEQLKVVKVQMAELRVQLASARRELREVAGRAEAAEARLQQQAAGYESRLAKLQAWYGKQAAVVAELRKGRAPRDGQVGFTNANRFWVPAQLLFNFLKHWVTREAALQQQEGFLGLQVQPAPAPGADGGVEVVVTSLWEDIPAWEAWHGTAAATQAHLPSGVMQYVPAKGEGFPEPFTPFRDYDAAVNAKYA